MINIGREGRVSEEAKGCISKGSVLTLLKYIPAALASNFCFSAQSKEHKLLIDISHNILFTCKPCSSFLGIRVIYFPFVQALLKYDPAALPNRWNFQKQKTERFFVFERQKVKEVSFLQCTAFQFRQVRTGFQLQTSYTLRLFLYVLGVFTLLLFFCHILQNCQEISLLRKRDFCNCTYLQSKKG